MSDLVTLERELLGGLLCYPERAGEVADRLKPGLIRSTQYRALYRAYCELAAAGAVVDVISLAAHLRAAHYCPATVRPAALVSEVCRGITSSAHLESHLDRINRSQVAGAAQDIGARLSELDRGGNRLTAALAAAREEIGDLELSLIDAPPATLKDILAATMGRVNKNFEAGPGALTGVDTGLKQLNAFTGGFQAGDLALLGADTGIGKTTLLTHHLITALKAPGGGRWLLISPEMTDWQIGLRFLAPLAALDLSRLDRGELKDQEWARLSSAVATLAKWNEGERLTVDLSSSSSPGRILAAARKLKRHGGLEGIAIDYLQLLTPDRPSHSREEDLNRIGWGLRQIAKELEVCVIALSQLNDSWKRPDKDGNERGRPKKGNLRGSRTMAHHAALVYLLHRNEEQAAAGISQVIVDKNRHGACGSFEVLHTLNHCKIKDLDYERY